MPQIIGTNKQMKGGRDLKEMAKFVANLPETGP